MPVIDHPAVHVRHAPVETLRTKCLVVGEAAAGKTSLLNALISRGATYPSKYNQTTYIQVTSRAVIVPPEPDEKPKHQVDFIFLDCPGAIQYNQRDSGMNHVSQWRIFGMTLS